MQVIYPSRESFYRTLQESETGSSDFIVVVTGAFLPLNMDEMKSIMEECTRVLREGGLLFVQGTYDYLSELGVFLDSRMDFKYWIAVESTERSVPGSLPSVHAGILIFSKGNGRLNVRKVRFPWEKCVHCHKSLRDWGGKTHLMHPDGCVVSDVWKELPMLNNYTQISGPVLETILKLPDFTPPRRLAKNYIPWPLRGIVGPKEAVEQGKSVSHIEFERPPVTEQYSGAINELSDDLTNVIHLGDALDVLKRYPDNCIDLAFADPPYNLNKTYNSCNDGWEDKDYLEWCDAWLDEYVRILKPTGSLYLHSDPTMSHYLEIIMDSIFGAETFRNEVIWKRTTATAITGRAASTWAVSMT